LIANAVPMRFAKGGLRTNKLREKVGSLSINDRPHSGIDNPECGHNRRNTPIIRSMAPGATTCKLTGSAPIEPSAAKTMSQQSVLMKMAYGIFPFTQMKAPLKSS